MALTKISTGMLKQDAASSDLNIDAGTLYIDVSNNRVGIANTSPTQALDVTGNALVSGWFRGAGGSASTPTFLVDGSTGMFRASSNDIGFSTAGSERMRIDSSGNVLIGTTSAYGTTGTTINAAGLVYSSSDGDRAGQFDRTTSDGEIVRFSKVGTTVGSIANDSTALVVTGASTGLKFGSAAIWPTTGGGVTNSNGAKDLGASTVKFKDLHLSGTVNAGAANISSSVAADYVASFENTNSTNGYGIKAVTAHTGTSAYAFGAYGGSNALMVVRGDGRVGIGTTSPGYKLEVNGTSSLGGGGNDAHKIGRLTVDYLSNGNPVLSSDGTQINFSDEIALRGVGIRKISTTPSNLNITQDRTGYDIVFNTSPTTNAVNEEVIRFTHDKRVGIGTTSPSAPLHVDGSVKIDAASGDSFEIYRSAASNFKVALGTANAEISSVASINIKPSGTTIQKYQLTADDFILNGPDLSIGTTSPRNSAKLTVAEGKINAGTASAVSGSVTIENYYGNGVLSAWGATYSSGGPAMLYGVYPSTTAQTEFTSSTGIALNRGAYVIDDVHRFYAGSNQTVAVGSNVTMSEVMRIESDGKVGIGNNDPQEKLHVSGGGIKVDGNGGIPSNSGAGVFLQYDSGNSLGLITALDQAVAWKSLRLNAADLQFYIAGGERMRIDSSGNVGIGTTTPEEKLHVLGQASFENAGNTNRGNIIMGAQGNGVNKWATLAGTHYNEATGSGNGSENAGVMMIGSHSTSTQNQVWIGHGPYEINPATEIRLGTHTTNTHNLGGTTHMIIDSAGKVGVGTTTPANPLHVVDSRNYSHSTTADSSTNMAGLRVTNSNNNSNWAGIWFATGSHTGSHWSGIAGARTDHASTWGTHLSFFTHEDATQNLTQATERMRISSEGTVGIGVTPSDANSATYKMQLYADAQCFMSFNNSATGTGNGNGLIVGNDHNGADLYQRENKYLRFHTNNTERVRITSDGNLLIGTTAVGAAGGATFNVSSNSADLTLYGVSTSHGGRLFFGDSSDRCSIQGIYDSGGGGRLTFHTDTTGGTNLERMRIDNNGRLILRDYVTNYNIQGSLFYEKRGGRRNGDGTYTLFTNGVSNTQSGGYVRVTAIYGTPSAVGVWLYKIGGNRSITLVWSDTSNYSGSTPSVTWSSSSLQVANSDTSTYYTVEVELFNIGIGWSATWGNFPGFVS